MNTILRILSLLIVFDVSLLFPQPSPQDKPDEWLLAFLDVETTGLRPGYHEIVNVGIVLSDLEGNEKARTIIYIMPNHPERMSKDAVAINGFDVTLWKSFHAFPVPTAVDSIISFYKQNAEGKHVIMVAYNSQFDAAFMDHLFRDAGKEIMDVHHYFVLDIPSMAWILGIRNLYPDDVARAFNTRGTSKVPLKHTGLGCADLNFRLYHELLKFAGKKKS